MAESRRDWAQLPAELIEKIAGHLAEIPDFFRFLSVCVSWRSAFRSISTDQQLPWLLIRNDGSRPPTNNGRSRLVSLSENRIYAISFPEYQSRRPADGSSPPLITRSSTPFPPLSSPEDQAWRFKLARVTLFGSDLVALHYESRILYCRPGETSWKKIDTSLLNPSGGLAYHDGRFFVFKICNEGIWVFDINGLQKVMEIPPECGYTSSY